MHKILSHSHPTPVANSVGCLVGQRVGLLLAEIGKVETTVAVVYPGAPATPVSRDDNQALCLRCQGKLRHLEQNLWEGWE